MKIFLDVSDNNSLPIKKRKIKDRKDYKRNMFELIDYKIDIPKNLEGIGITNEYDSDIVGLLDINKRNNGNESRVQKKNTHSIYISDDEISDKHLNSCLHIPTCVKIKPKRYICYIHNHDQSICAIYDCGGIKVLKSGILDHFTEMNCTFYCSSKNEEENVALCGTKTINQFHESNSVDGFRVQNHQYPKLSSSKYQPSSFLSYISSLSYIN